MAPPLLGSIGAIAFGLFCRALYYRQVFGRWVIRLRPEESKRLLPADNRAAYAKGYEDGKRAAHRAILDRKADVNMPSAEGSLGLPKDYGNA